jgi:hypothetical protein
MHARDMRTCEIVGHLRDLYGIGLPHRRWISESRSLGSIAPTTLLAM